MLVRTLALVVCLLCAAASQTLAQRLESGREAIPNAEVVTGMIPTAAG